MSAPYEYADVFAKLVQVKPLGPGQWNCYCPVHEADGSRHRPSLKLWIDDAGNLRMYCYAGCSIRDLNRALGITAADCRVDKQPPPRSQGRKRRQQSQPKPKIAEQDKPWTIPDREIEQTYDYTDQYGELLFQVVRLKGKRFYQRRPAAGDTWVMGLGECRRVLYRLPSLFYSGKRAVFVCEGEKDADNLAALDLVATTCPMGAGKWRPEYTQFIAGRPVVILPDNDPPCEKTGKRAGEEHARKVLEATYDAAAWVRIVRLPGLPPKGDPSDWIASGGTREELMELVRQTPIEPKPGGSRHGHKQRAVG